ncbi:MAG TPA: vitamin K epoxide reductase family protein [Thermoplasmata archaeon]|nr:vitamin K epoxide reductase family protein [Thermoplasmata archaeon]
MAPGSLSRGDRLALVLVLAIAGALVSAYLMLDWYRAASSSWCDVSSFFSCTRVRDSAFAAVGGVPTAVVGLVGFAILASLAVMALQGRTAISRWRIEGWMLLFALIGAGIGAALTVLEVFVIQAVCLLCAVGFGLDLAILAVTATLRASDS